MDFLKTKKYDSRFSLLSEAVQLASRKEYTEKYDVKYQYIGHVSSDLCSVDPQQVLVEVL